MLYLVVFVILTLAGMIFWHDLFFRRLKVKQAEKQEFLDEFNVLLKDQERLIRENTLAQRIFTETLELYELTKDICQSLDKEKVFAIFRENLKKYIGIGDCRFVENSVELTKYKNYLIVPLNIEAHAAVGYLAVDRILEADKEKFAILTQQFLIGLRRALLYQKVQGLTIMDSLTQVYCRRYFLERFHAELRRAKKNKLHLSFLMADIDNFKQFNDRYGHLVGDAILRQVAKTISETVRQIDFIGRYGGEELAVVLAETDNEQAIYAAERIRQAIASTVIKVYDEKLKVTVSIGVAIFPDNSDQMRDLIELADQALYLAKETGKNKVCFSPS